MIEYYDIRKDTQNGPIGILSPEDRRLLRTLSERLKELSADPVHQERKRLWESHNSLGRKRPMLLTFPEGAWSEIIPQSGLSIQDPFWRSYEWYLKRLIYRGEKIHDDFVLEGVIEVPLVHEIGPWGIRTQQRSTEAAKGAWGFSAVLESPEDAERIATPQLTVDERITQRNTEAVAEVVGDLLPVRVHRSIPLDLSLVCQFTVMRGMEALMMDFFDRPQWVHGVLRRLQYGTLDLMKQVKEKAGLALNNGNDYIGSGGLGFTDELPRTGSGPSIGYSDLWGFANAQEFANVSPDMFEEFALQYQIPILECFGLNCYGCCEPVHDRIERIKKVPRLRRVSVSPWTDLRKAADAIEDRYIYSCKPNPAPLAFGTDRKAMEKDLKRIMEAASGCVLEIIMKDTHTLGNRPENLLEWVDAARQVVEMGYP